jgi:SAM-dependent methyltransferase
MKTLQREPYIIDSVRGRSVLHLGCTNYPYTETSIASGTFLHSKIADVAREVYGFDSDQRGIDLLVKLGFENLYHADLENLEAVGLNKNFDVVVAGEMIEHLPNPGLFLRGIKRFLRDDSLMILTTPNAYSVYRFVIYSLRGKKGINEPVHTDHVAYYSYRTICRLLELSGYEIEDFCFYDIGTEHRPYNRWIYNFVNDVSVALFPQLSDGLIAVCRKREEAAAV